MGRYVSKMVIVYNFFLFKGASQLLLTLMQLKVWPVSSMLLQRTNSYMSIVYGAEQSRSRRDQISLWK